MVPVRGNCPLGLLAYRELDDAIELTEMAGEIFADNRTGKNGRHGMIGLFRQSVFGRLGGYEDVNDADRLGRDPAMRWIVGGHAIKDRAASTSQMGRFETELLATDENLAIDRVSRCLDRQVHDRRPPKMIILDIDSSVSPKGCSSLGGWTVVQFPRIWMSSGECRMKAFVAGCAAAVVLAVVAAVVLNQLGFGTAEVYATSNVRL